jgi:hypothetical protein
MTDEIAERFPYKEEVTGSNNLTQTLFLIHHKKVTIK